VRTILGELSVTIATIVRQPVALTGSGRTDAGVHAWGQVVTVMLPEVTDLARLSMSLNRMLGPEIAVREADWVDDDFSARFSATARTYRYDVWNDPAPNPLIARHVWHVGPSLDLEQMNLGAVALVGEHDFSSFCRRPKPGPGYDPPSLVRRIQAAGWTRPDDSPLLRFEISATSFCHQMVRSVVGTLVDVGHGMRRAELIPDILAAQDRNAAGQVAPPTGLTLWSVSFEGKRWDAGLS
jgi:tRNA pseudouridine38-40 synthase